MPAEFNPDWTLEPRERMAVALSIALNGSPGWAGAEDDEMDRIAGRLIELLDAEWMRDVLRARRRSLEQGELRSVYNEACDRLDVLASKLVERASE